MGYDLKIVFNLENLIISSLDWNLNTSTIFELSEAILKEVIDQTELPQLHSIKEMYKNYALFALDSK